MTSSMRDYRKCVLRRLRATQTTCLVKYGNKKTLKKNVEKKHKLINKETMKRKSQSITGRRVLVKLPCSFQERRNVIVRLLEQFQRSISSPTVATLSTNKGRGGLGRSQW